MLISMSHSSRFTFLGNIVMRGTVLLHSVLINIWQKHPYQDTHAILKVINLQRVFNNISR
jgi:hypothetical protein